MSTSSTSGPWEGWLGVCWGLSIVELVAVAAYALFMAWRWRGRNHNTEEFITARKQVPLWKIAWSFYAGTMGAWVISSMSSYAAVAGLIGLFSYSISTGLPILMIAFAGPLIERGKPHAMSLSEFTGWRFGVVAQIGITLLTILTMAIFVLVEYVTIGTFFAVYVGSVAYPIVITVGLLTLGYTAVGGLYVSIATDQVQGIASFILMIVVAIYLGVTFKQPLPTPMDDMVIGNTVVGLSSIFTMPASMFSATVFNEAMWQRAFAAENPRKLKIAGCMAACAAILVTFISGLCGWLAAWADPATVFAANVNMYMFYGLEGTIDVTTGTVNNFMGVVVLLIAVVMNEGTIDSLQNGLLASFSSFTSLGIRFYRQRRPGKLPRDYQIPLWVTRLLVVLINIPLIVLGTLGSTENWSIMDLFLISNMMVCTISVPMMCGLSTRLRPYFGGVSFILSWIAGFVSPSLYGIFKECYESEIMYDPTTFMWVCVPTPGADGGGAGMAFTWYHNGYQWQYFLLAIGCSTGAMVLCLLVNFLLVKRNVRLPSIPGFIPLSLEDEVSEGSEESTSVKDVSVMGSEKNVESIEVFDGVYPEYFFAPGEEPAPYPNVTPADVGYGSNGEQGEEQGFQFY